MSNLNALWALLATVLIWSSSFAVIKLGLEQINPYFLAFIRALIAAVFLGSIIALKGEGRVFLRYVRERWRILSLLGLVGIALFDVLQNVGIHHTSSALAGILLNTNPLFITLLSAMFLREIITRGKLAGVLIGFAGMCVVVLFGAADLDEVLASQTFIGNVLIVLSAVTWAVYSILNKRAVAGSSPLHLTCAMYVFGTLFSLPLLGLFDTGQLVELSLRSWAIIVYLGGVASGLTFFLWSFALSRMEASRASVFLFLIPIAAIFVGWAFLHERITAAAVLGSLLVVAGIYLSERSAAAPSPQDLEPGGIRCH